MKLLVIDDDKGIGNYLKKAFNAQNFETDVSCDGEEGCFLALTNNYDLIVLDYNLPGKNGKEICREIRAEGVTVPIIMLSVLTEPFTKADMLNLGADDYLTKPFSFEELLARIKAVARRSGDIKPNNIKIDDLEIDSQKMVVSRAGVEIYLTVKEFMLLELLAKNCCSVVTRAIITEKIWDYSADPFSNTVEVHISNLRKKINKKGLKKLIQTVPGRGYKISTKDCLRKN